MHNNLLLFPMISAQHTSYQQSMIKSPFSVLQRHHLKAGWHHQQLPSHLVSLQLVHAQKYGCKHQFYSLLKQAFYFQIRFVPAFRYFTLFFYNCSCLTTLNAHMCMYQICMPTSIFFRLSSVVAAGNFFFTLVGLYFVERAGMCYDTTIKRCT